MEFSNDILQNLEDDFLSRLIFRDEATFYISSKVKRQNVQIRELENPQEILEHHRDSPKLNVFSAVFVKKASVLMKT